MMIMASVHLINTSMVYLGVTDVGETAEAREVIPTAKLVTPVRSQSLDAVLVLEQNESDVLMLQNTARRLETGGNLSVTL